MTRRGLLALLPCMLIGQQPRQLQQPQQAPPIDFICPMDPDVHSKTPGKCPRCGMTLEARIPAPVEYPMRVAIDPPAIPAGQPLGIDFRVEDPKTGAPVKDFQIVHEKYFHLFSIRSDLEFFAHEHPVLGPDGVFRHHMSFPRPGHYKLIGDFYPSGGTPQLVSKIVTTAGYSKSIEESCT
ncbi:MAG: hypothetical protein M3Z85_20795, partial [Acidobacteriota bacterium]|nr:hypothetical protein [Acidobacteriota bacterium]